MLASSATSHSRVVLLAIARSTTRARMQMRRCIKSVLYIASDNYHIMQVAKNDDRQ